MSETFYLVSNGSRAVAVSFDQILDAQRSNVDFDVDDEEMCKVAAMALAGERFQKHRQPHQDLKVTDVVTLDGSALEDGTEVEEPSDIGLTENLYVEAAGYCFGDDDWSFDTDAEVSGLNVQAWRYLSPTGALEALTRMPPARIRRQFAPRGEQVRQELEILKAQVRTLLGAVTSLTASGAQPSPEAVDQLAQQARIVEQLLGQAGTGEQIVHATTIRSWEVGEGSAGDLSEEQKKPWAVTVSTLSDKLVVNVWPAGTPAQEAEAGLAVMFEVSKGYPAAYVAPNCHGDNAIHVYGLNAHEVQVTPAASRPPAPTRNVVHDNDEPVWIVSNGQKD